MIFSWDTEQITCFTTYIAVRSFAGTFVLLITFCVAIFVEKSNICKLLQAFYSFAAYSPEVFILAITIKFVTTMPMTEVHPLEPFLPQGARILILGSFPPPKSRWCMDFFYPNWTNDFWRIWGLIAVGDKDYFVVPGEKRFDKERIAGFCRERGIALYDTAAEVIRLRNNASDNFLQIVRPTDLPALLERVPGCHTIVATGQKSAETLQSLVGFETLPVGEYCDVMFQGRNLRIWRMPSSSRAYPRPIEWKAEYYKRVLG